MLTIANFPKFNEKDIKTFKNIWLLKKITKPTILQQPETMYKTDQWQLTLICMKYFCNVTA